MEDLTLEQMNWEICIAHLDDSVKYLQECIDEFDKAMRNLRELKGIHRDDA